MRRPVEIISGSLAAAVITAALGCAKGNEGQQSINPSQSPLAGNAKTEAITAETPVLVRPATPTELASWIPASASTATRIPETPTTAPATRTPFPPTKVPDTATAVPPTKAPDTATAIPAAAVPDKTPTTLATPEANRFVPYGVYANEDTVVATLPDGRIIVAARKDQPRCSNSSYYVFNFITSTKYDPNKEFVEFNDPNAMARKILVSLLGNNNKSAMVILTEQGHVSNSPSGSITCQASEVKSKVQFMGIGRAAFLSVFPKVIGATTEEVALQRLQQTVGKLPD